MVSGKDGGATMDDNQAMARCIELAGEAGDQGNGPFGSVIVRDGAIVAEGRNSVKTDLDPTAHAEVAALRNACRALGTLDLSGCTLFTSCEPCWICSTAIRETRISRVVFAAKGRSGTGGFFSAYPILRDPDVGRYAPPPEVLPGLLNDRAETLFVTYNWPPPEA